MINKGINDLRDMRHICGRSVMGKEFQWKKWKERDHLKRLDADGKIILKQKYENRIKGFNWIYLTQEKDT